MYNLRIYSNQKLKKKYEAKMLKMYSRPKNYYFIELEKKMSLIPFQQQDPLMQLAEQQDARIYV